METISYTRDSRWLLQGLDPHLSGTLWWSWSEILSCLALASVFTLFWGALSWHKLSATADPTGMMEDYLPEGLEPTNTQLLLCQQIRGDLVSGWAASCPGHCLGGCLVLQILHLLMAFEEPCFWGTRSCIITTASWSLAAGRAKQSQTSTPGVSWLGCPAPPSLHNRAVLSSPSSLLVSAGSRSKRKQHPKVLVFSCTQTWAGISWTANSHDLPWSLSEFSGFVFFYPLQFWYVVSVYKF